MLSNAGFNNDLEYINNLLHIILTVKSKYFYLQIQFHTYHLIRDSLFAIRKMDEKPKLEQMCFQCCILNAIGCHR